MVLEARKDAETVGYNIVGEETKEASNVVDYNLNEEITKDTSSVVNANNDTTTGMANVIPGVNAPKLVAETSIVGGGGTEIVNISDYTSIDEWQPIVEKIIGGHFIVVRCKFTSYSNLMNFFFLPCYYIPNQAVRFGATYVGSHRFRINCWVTGTTITSITTTDGAWNANS